MERYPTGQDPTRGGKAARKRKSKAPGAASLARRASGNCSSTMTTMPLSRRVQSVEEASEGGRRLEGGSGREQRSLPVEEKRNKLSRPPPLGGETGERSDDERV